jgi:hypothetical protein
MLQFTKLPDNLNLPRDPQKVIEYKGWRNTAETFLNAYGSTLAIFKAKKWSWEIKMTPTILAAYLQLIGTPHDTILTSTQMHERHNQCVFENLVLSTRNFNIWKSVVCVTMSDLSHVSIYVSVVSLITHWFCKLKP